MASRAVRPLSDIGIGDRPLAGGKGASLGELLRAGFPVPDGFVVTAPACTELLARLGPPGPAQATPALRARIETAPLPAGLLAAITTHYCALGGAGQERPPPRRPGAAAGPPVAVRSSATAEDSAAASFAGIAESYLWVRGADAVAEHVRKCWASLYRAELVSYRQHRGLPETGLAMAVVVQRMVDARCSGVMFTRSPAAEPGPPAAAGTRPGPARDGLAEVRAPLPGTFYRAPRPGAPPFVELGSPVGPDTVVGIVETMKLMNSVCAGRRGTVAELCVADAEFTPQDAVLMRIEPGPA